MIDTNFKRIAKNLHNVGDGEMIKARLTSEDKITMKIFDTKKNRMCFATQNRMDAQGEMAIVRTSHNKIELIAYGMRHNIVFDFDELEKGTIRLTQYDESRERKYSLREIFRILKWRFIGIPSID